MSLRSLFYWRKKRRVAHVMLSLTSLVYLEVQFGYLQQHMKKTIFYRAQKVLLDNNGTANEAFLQKDNTSESTRSKESSFVGYYEDYGDSLKKQMVFVHLGKTAGSSITCMLDPSVHHSGHGDSHCASTNDTSKEQQELSYPSSAISQHVVERVHLKPAPIDSYDNFLITLRNPVDRIISWFYYVHPLYPPIKLDRHKRGCENYKMFDCWDNIQSLSEEGLIEIVGGDAPARSTSTNYNISTSTEQQVVTSSYKECQKWAWDNITGRSKCWHNYFNYNYTYGNLLQAITNDDDHESIFLVGNDTETTTSKASKMRKRKRKRNIFAIRTEHLKDDWKTIDLMLGGNVEAQQGLSILYKNEWKTKYKGLYKIMPNSTLSYQGKINLCKALCEEIQIYKQLLNLALNIGYESRNESLEGLLQSCPNESRDIKVC